MWNDTDIPLAYLITFRTYGSWLHGDPRGSVSRHKNTYGSAKLRHERNWLETNTSRLKDEPVILTGTQRQCVKRSNRETCEIRKWDLLAVSIRTNHGHAVVAAGIKLPGTVLNALKANATRALREQGLWTLNHSPWVDKGSTRYLWNENSVGNACAYVEYEQGDVLPDFD